MDIKEVISNNCVASDYRILNILNDLGYFKEHPNHKLVIRTLVENKILFKLIDMYVSESEKTRIFHDFISNTGFDTELTASIFSSISGLSFSVFDDRIQWSPSLSKEDMEKYVLQHLSYFFDKRIIIKDVSCTVWSIDRFVIGFEFQKSSWNFDYEKENEYFIKLGQFMKCKSNEVALEVWTRSGNDIKSATGAHDTNKVDFEWDDPFEAIGDESEVNWVNTDKLILSININHPIHDISWIQVKHPC